ncbi:MAG: hypothetical protein PHE02_12030 [Lachnospiraceae bacterium]|nr:hypothetical protein [Lachnospiraceae bacterium]
MDFKSKGEQETSWKENVFVQKSMESDEDILRLTSRQRDIQERQDMLDRIQLELKNEEERVKSLDSGTASRLEQEESFKKGSSKISYRKEEQLKIEEEIRQISESRGEGDSKAERKDWKNKKTQALRENLQSVRESSVKEYYQYLNTVDKTRQKLGTDKPADYLSALQKENEVTPLTALFASGKQRELSENEETRGYMDAIKKIYPFYLQINNKNVDYGKLLEEFRNAHIVSNTVADIRLKDSFVVEKEQYGRTFLMEAITAALQENLNALPREALQESVYLKLYTMTRCSNLMGSALNSSKAFQKERNEFYKKQSDDLQSVLKDINNEVDHRKKIRQEVEASRERRKDYLEKGYGLQERTDTRAGEWYLGRFPAYIIENCGKQLDQLNNVDYASALEKMNKTCSDNRTAILRALQFTELSQFSDNNLMQDMAERVFNGLGGEAALRSYYKIQQKEGTDLSQEIIPDQELVEKIKGEIGGMQSRMEEWHTDLEIGANEEEIQILRELHPTILKNVSISEEYFKYDKKEDRESYAAAFRENMVFKTRLIKKYILEHARKAVDVYFVYDKMIENYGDMFLSHVPYGNMAAAADMIMGRISIHNANRDTQALYYEELLRKYQLGRYGELVDQELRNSQIMTKDIYRMEKEEERKEALGNEIERISINVHKNEDYIQELIKKQSVTLTEKQCQNMKNRLYQYMAKESIQEYCNDIESLTEDRQESADEVAKQSKNRMLMQNMLWDSMSSIEGMAEILKEKKKVFENTMVSLIQAGAWGEYGLVPGQTYGDLEQISFNHFKQLQNHILTQVLQNKELLLRAMQEDRISTSRVQGWLGKLLLGSVDTEELQKEYDIILPLEVEKREILKDKTAIEIRGLNLSYRRPCYDYLREKANTARRLEGRLANRQQRMEIAERIRSKFLGNSDSNMQNAWMELMKAYQGKSVDNIKRAFADLRDMAGTAFVADSEEMEYLYRGKGHGILSDTSYEMTIELSVIDYGWMIMQEKTEENSSGKNVENIENQRSATYQKQMMEEYSSITADQEYTIMEAIQKKGLPEGTDCEHIIKGFQNLRYKFYEMMKEQGNTEELREQFKKDVNDALTGMMGMSVKEKERLSDRIDIQKKRVAEIERMENGALMPLLSKLLQKDDIYVAFTLPKDTEFENLKAKIQERLLPLMTMLQRKFGYISIVYDQIVNTCGEDLTALVEPETLSLDSKFKEEWQKRFREIEKQVLTHSITGKQKQTIQTRLEKFLNDSSYGDVAKYFGAIYKAEGNSLGFILTDDKLEEVVNRCRKNIKVNTELRNRFVADKLGAIAKDQKAASQVAAMEKELFWYTEEAAISNLTAADYQNLLEEKWLLCMANRVSAEGEVAAAQERLRPLREQKEKIQQEKQKGYELYEKRREHSLEVGIARRDRVSPYLKRSGVKGEDVISEKDQQKLRTTLGEKMSKWLKPDEVLTPPILDGMCEYAMVHKDEKEQRQQLRYLLDVDQYLRSSEQTKLLNDEDYVAFMHYLNIFTQERELRDITRGNQIHEGMLLNTLQDYQSKRKLLTDYKALEKEVKGQEHLQLEYQELARTLSYDMYVMEKHEFVQEANQYMQYIRSRGQLDKCIDKEMAEHMQQASETWSETEQKLLKAGLTDFFLAELLDDTRELNEAGMADMLRRFFADSVMVRAMMDSENLMEGVGSDSLGASEIGAHTTMDRIQFETFFTKYASDDQCKIFNQQLDTIEKRQIFALTLALPQLLNGENATGSMRLTNDEADEEQLQVNLKRYLASYIAGEKTDTTIPYSLALEMLTQTKDQKMTIKQEYFDKAIQFVQVCERSRQEAIPADMDALNDYEKILEIQGKKPVSLAEKEKDISFETLQNELLSSVEGTENKVCELLRKLDDNEKVLLVQVLQDRTLLDYSTKVSWYDKTKGTMPDYVNQEKREEMLSQYVYQSERFYQRAMDTRMLERAFLALQSSQVRDDVDLRGVELTKSHLQTTIAKRKTPYDWKLLGEAISFVKEMELKKSQMSAVKQAYSANMITKYGNPEAKAAYREIRDQEKTFTDMKSMDQFFTEQAKRDGRDDLLAGYLTLNESQKTLFIKAMANRDLVDISKEGIMLNRFGWKDRDYVNPTERNAVLDTYVEHGSVKLLKSDYEQAIRGSLSAQLDDTYAYQEMTDSLYAKVSTEDSIFKEKRKTAVDWKLFMRAMQMVNRGENERITLLGNTEIYRSQGDLMHGDSYAQDMTLLRQNIHNAGNRITRFAGRRVGSRINEKIPGPLRKIANVVLPVSWNREISKITVFQKEEDKAGFAGKAATISEWTDTVSGVFDEEFFAKEYVDKGMKWLGASDVIRDKAGKIATGVQYVNDGIQVADAAIKKKKFKDESGKLHANHTEEEDLKVMHEAERKQDEVEKRLVAYIVGRHEKSMSLSEEQVKLVQSNELTSSIATLIGDITNDLTEVGTGNNLLGSVLKIVIEEAGHIINAVRTYYKDKEKIYRYYNVGEALGRYDEKLKAQGVDARMEEKDQSKALDFFISANGFEDMTELSTHVGMNMVESVLFAASRFNERMPYMKLVSTMVLRSLGLTDLIGNVSADASNQVFDAIMEKKYR